MKECAKLQFMHVLRAVLGMSLIKQTYKSRVRPTSLGVTFDFDLNHSAECDL